MSDPMSLFESESKKDKDSRGVQPTPTEGKKPQESNNQTDLPDNWKEQVDEIREDILAKRKEREEIAKRYNMTPEEFDAYLDNPSNFSQEEWEVLESARKERVKFMAQMEEILGGFVKKELKRVKKKNRVGPGRNWISVE